MAASIRSRIAFVSSEGGIVEKWRFNPSMSFVFLKHYKIRSNKANQWSSLITSRAVVWSFHFFAACFLSSMSSIATMNFRSLSMGISFCPQRFTKLGSLMDVWYFGPVEKEPRSPPDLRTKSSIWSQFCCLARAVNAIQSFSSDSF